MASSLTSPALAFSADRAIVAARKALAKASLFATDFSADAVQPGTTLKIPVFTPNAATTFNAATNNYETVDGSVTYVPVTFAHHVKNTFAFDDKDFLEANGSNFWANAGRASGDAIAQAIITAVSGLIDENTVTASHTLSTVSKTTIAGLRTACVNAEIDPARTVVMLQPTQFAALLATLDANIYGGAEAIREGIVKGLYGFKAVCENSDLDSTLTGALVPEDALVIAGRAIPVMSPGIYEEVGTTRDELSGLVIGTRRHGNPATGANYLTHEALFGSALVQPSKCVRLIA